jgi:bifunctional pyridoxal-dependent enzyme with beta-cystathionase and maltose regulon repressor activities
VSKSSVRHSDYGALKTTSPGASYSLELELKIADICMENGVMIAPGHVYMAEEYGWFRITFTVGQDALEEGLKRF